MQIVVIVAHVYWIGSGRITHLACAAITMATILRSALLAENILLKNAPKVGYIRKNVISVIFYENPETFIWLNEIDLGQTYRQFF